MAKTRTFIAIEVTPEVQARAADLVELLAPHTRNVRWVNDGHLHFTLQFLGDLTDQEIVDVCTRTKQVADRTEAFGLQAAGAGAFPSIDRPRTLWIGAGAGRDVLCRLQADLEAALDDLGFRGEHRRYVPHLTIGKTTRTARDAAELTPLLEELSSFDAGIVPVTEVTVFASELARGGPEYHVLARRPLVG